MSKRTPAARILVDAALVKMDAGEFSQKDIDELSSLPDSPATREAIPVIVEYWEDHRIECAYERMHLDPPEPSYSADNNSSVYEKLRQGIDESECMTNMHLLVDEAESAAVKHLTSDQLTIMYFENDLPKGIRDRSGYLFFFREVTRYPDQNKRYAEECDQMHELADFVLEKLKAERNARDRIITTST